MQDTIVMTGQQTPSVIMYKMLGWVTFPYMYAQCDMYDYDRANVVELGNISIPDN